MAPKKNKDKKPVKPPSDDEEEEVSEADSEPAPKAAPKKSLFAMMQDSDDDDGSEEEEEEEEKKEEEKLDFGKKKKKESKESKESKGDDDEPELDFGKKKKKESKEGKEKKDKAEKKEKKEKKKRGPTVCEVIEASPIPKKDKLKLCKVLVTEGVEVEIVTSAPNVAAGKKFICAPPGYTTATGIEVKVAKVGGVESCGMFCGPKEMGWDTDELDENLAVMLADDAEVGAPAPTYEEAVEALKEREKAAKAAKEAAASKESSKDDGKKKKGKKGKGKVEDDEDFDAALNEFKGPEPEKKEEPEEKAEVPAEAKTEPQEEAKSAAQKKKDKKKAKKGGAADDDDLDAALEEFKSDEKPAEKPDDKPAEAAAAPAAETKDDAGEEVLDAKTLANRKKKDKKKAKNAAVGGEGMWGGAADGETPKAAEDEKAEAAPAPAPAADAGGKKEKEKGGKKESAIVKAARERMEAERKLEEERKAFEEEQRRIIEEEKRKEEEEAERERLERQRKRDARQAKIQKQKEAGTYLTKSQKLKAQRAAQLREQFGFNMDEVGDDDDEDGENKKEEEEKKPQKRPMATKKKKQQPKPGEAKAEEPDEDQVEEPKVEEKVAKKEEPAKPTKEPEKDEDEDDDEWEKIAEEKESDKEEEEKEEAGSDSEDDENGSSSSSSSGSSSSSFPGYRSPIICIMGHVDTGKTKLLDKIRRTNVQEGEAGGITQQIGATFFPDIALQEQTKKVDKEFELEVPGLLIIDTPGHESFNNLRKRGSSMADLAILVIDIMHGLEPQTVESLEMLKKRRCPFIIAMNKIDVLYQWQSKPYTSVREAMDRQVQSVRDEFQDRFQNIMLQLNERGLNCNLYWENEDFRSAVSIVPTSALTGEGVPDLLYMLLRLTQDLMSDKLEISEELECTVIEVKNIEGLGTTIDVVLLNGTLREGDKIVLAGLGGPIETTIRALLTPQPMKEMRVKGDYMHHAEISTSMGVKICAPGLEDAVAGTELLVVGPDDDIEELKEQVSDGFESILNDFEKQPAGVYVKASTLGSLEALLSFLSDMKIPVFDVGIGEVHKKDVKKACVMKEKKFPEYALILAFDVKVNAEATKQADSDGVTIFTADIIYHLQDKFTKYMEKYRESQKTDAKKEAVFPVVLQMDKNYIFRKHDPLIVGCTVVGGQLRTGTPICVPEKDNLVIGHVGGIEKDKKPVPKARRGDSVCVKIEQNTGQNHITYGRHFDHTNQLYSLITRDSIDTLKAHFKDEMQKEDWELIIGMKTLFKIN